MLFPLLTTVTLCCKTKMMGMKKAILPVVTGTMVGIMVSVIGEKVVMASNMPSDNESIGNQEVAIQWFSTLPVSAFVLLAVFAGVGAIVAGIAANKLSDTNGKLSLTITSILLSLAAAYKLYLISFQPFTYGIIRVAMIVPLVIVGDRIAKRLPGKLTS